jgi:glyceraldehyde-3-phosphate dehydrogenase/erythrose-4-phosphate dehydrogenase
MSSKRIIHVVGTGTIGEPLIGLLCEFQKELGIDEVTFHKNSVSDRPKVKALLRRGARLSVDAANVEGFRAWGIEPDLLHDQALDEATVVIDCSPKGLEMKGQLYRQYEHNTLGFIAQGSEFGFGTMYARGVNDEVLTGKDQYVQVVSCNTHNLSCILQTLALSEGNDNLLEGTFVCMRRANDISQVKDFSPAPQVGGHKDGKFGTHHARDAYHLFQTKGLELNLFSSAIKLPTQYMHSLWFDLRLRRPTTLESLKARIKANDRIAVTEKKDANTVFSFGRDQGHFGRILNQTVIPVSTLTMPDPNRVVGFCFTPQDGNSLLSSVSAALHFIHPEDWEQRIQVLKPFFFDEV